MGGVALQTARHRHKLFCLGLTFGPGLGVLHPSESLGWLFRPLVSSLVAIIVFEVAFSLISANYRKRVTALNG